jgi:AraC family transcriptional regulator
MSYFERIHEGNKLSLNKSLHSDMIYYSELKEWHTDNAFRSFGVKFVLDQCIQYKVEGKEYKVHAGHYMLACRQADVKAYFHTATPVKSICIDICPRSFAEAYHLLLAKNDTLDTGVLNYFRYPEFCERINTMDNSTLSCKLQSIFPLIASRRIEAVNKEWFLDLAEKIIYKEYGNYIALKNIHSIRASTRKEILRRLQLGKEYMDEHFQTIKEIRQVAEFSNMSEYHFFRSFKQAFGMTPFQYLTGKKMALAKELVKDREKKLADIALTCNFPDVFTFSKAFKRYYGVPPSAMR